MLTWELSSQSGRRVKDNRHWTLASKIWTPIYFSIHGRPHWLPSARHTTLHWCCLHIYPKNLWYLEWTSYGTVKSCGTNMHSGHPPLYSWSDLWCQVSTDYSQRTDWLLMINMSILVKCTVNCTGTLLTKPGGCICCLLTSQNQVV